MTITTTKRKAGPYHGDGMSVLFPFDFRVFEAQDLHVTYADESGAERVLSLNTDYKVNLNIDQETVPGGNVILNKALQHGNTITLTSGMAYLQPTKLTNHGGFYPTVINDALDRLTIFVQQLEEQVDRSVKVTVSSETSPDELVASINESASAARQSAEVAQASESNSKQNAEIAQNAADALTQGLLDLAGIKTDVDALQEAVIPATVAEIQNGQAGKLVDAAGLKAFFMPVGMMQLMPFRATELPFGWYHANGELFSVDSMIGQALRALPEGYKEDWRIIEQNGEINLPNMYHEDGRGYFERAGNMPGVVQEDAIRNIKGTFAAMVYGNGQTGSGVILRTGFGTNNQINGGSIHGQAIYTFNASNTVPTSDENRPLNIFFVPAIYLGVDK